MLADFLFTIGAVLMGTAPTIPILIIGRLVVGVSYDLLKSRLELVWQLWLFQYIFLKLLQRK